MDIKKVLLLALTLALSYSKLIGQENLSTKELLNKIENSDGKQKVDFLNEIAWRYRKIQKDSALFYATESINIAEALNYNEGHSTALNRKGLVLKNKNLYKEALVTYQKALAIENKIGNNFGIARANYQIGSVFEKMGLHQEALKHYETSLPIFRGLDDTNNLGKTLNKIAINTQDLGDYHKAILTFEQALDLKQQVKDSLGIINTKLDLSILYQQLKYFNKANIYLKECASFYKQNDFKEEYFTALHNLGNNFYYLGSLEQSEYYFNELLQDSLEDKSLKANIYNSIGAVYQDQELFWKAQENYELALILFTKINDINGIGISNASLGIIYGKDTSDVEKAIFHLEKGLSHIDSTDNISFKLDILSALSESYLKAENWEKAAETNQRYIFIKENLTENKRMASAIKADLEKEVAILKEQKQKQRVIFIALLVSLSLAIAMAFFAFRSYKNKQKIRDERKSNELKQRKIDSLLSEIELQSTYAKLQGQDDERKRIAKDLHDRLGGILSTIKLYFNSVNDKIDDLKQENLNQYQKANQLLDKAVEEVRAIAHNMESGILSKFGLVAELENLVENIQESKQIKIQFITHGMRTRLDNKMEAEIYKIIQELVSNILKHADATKITLQIIRDNNAVNILVEDDGKGFILEEVKRGMGLKNIALRVDNLNGELLIDSTVGRGSTISIDFTIQNKNIQNDKDNISR